MNYRFGFFSQCLLLQLCWVSSVVATENTSDSSVDDFFAMSPTELAAIPIVAIATGTPKPISQAASVTSVITAEQIKAMGATELHEILESVAGVHGGLQPNQYDYNYSIRGMKNAANSQVLMLLNGIRTNIPFRGTSQTHFEMPVEAIQRVEVIRGPASAVYGADAFAGVINIVTKKADDMHGATLGVRAGNWNTHSTWGQFGTDWAGWKIANSLQYQYTDGDNGRMIGGDLQTMLDKNFGTRASHAPSAMQTRYETLNGHLNLQRKHWDINFWGFAQIDGGVRAGVSGALDPTGKSNSRQLLADVRFSTEDYFKNWELQARLSYLYTDFSMQIQVLPDGTQVSIDPQGNILPIPRTSQIVSFPQGVRANVGRVEQVPTLEFNSIYRGFDQHIVRLITAIRAESINTTESKNFGGGIIDGTKTLPATINGSLTDITGTSAIYVPNTQRIISSFAFQDEWQLAKKWQLTTGVRYDYYSDFGSTVNPRVALVWDINAQLTSKLLYGKAFRAPSFNEQYSQNNPVLVGNKNLTPEITNNIELVFDYHPTPRLRTALNLYAYEINGLIVPLPDAGKTTATFKNFGDHHGYGGELEWDWKLYEKWQLSGNYAWQQAYKEDTNESVTGVPEHHVYVALDWQVSQQWHLRPQVNWIAGRQNAANDNRPLNDYASMDLTLRGKKLFNYLNVTASLHNIFDSINREPAEFTFSQNLPLAGRSFYLETSINF